MKETYALIAQVAASGLSEEAKYDVLHELSLKRTQFQRGVIQAMGVTIEATVAPKREPARNNFAPNGPLESFAFAVPGQDFVVKVHLNNPGATPLKLDRLWLATPAGETWTVTPESPIPTSLAANKALDERLAIHAPENAALTRPYFSRPNDEQPYYDLNDERYRNLSTVPYPVSAWTEFTYNGVTLRLGQVVQTVRQETGPGVLLNPLMIAPAVSVRITPTAGISPLGEKSFALSALVNAAAETGAKGTVHLELPAGWRSDPAQCAVCDGARGPAAKRRFPHLSRPA